MEAEVQARTCYRHPDRETGVSCSSCDRPICPECMTSTSVGMRCPECAGERTKVRSGASAYSASGDPVGTYALIALNVIVYLASIGVSGGAASVDGGGSLNADGGLFGPAIDQGGEWYRIVTSGFLHAGFLHLGLNMFVLYILGRLLEPALGTPRFVALYFTSLLAGSLGALLIEPDSLTVGASGAVYGLMAATIIIARRRGAEDIASQLGLWLGLNLLLTFSIPQISIGGHVGGLIGGAIAAFAIELLDGDGRSRRPAVIAAQIAVMVAISAACVAGSLWAAGEPGGVI